MQAWCRDVCLRGSIVPVSRIEMRAYIVAVGGDGVDGSQQRVFRAILQQVAPDTVLERLVEYFFILELV